MKRTQQYLICDVCGKNRATTWTIGTPQGEKARVDLCSRCDDPVRKAFIAGRKSHVGPVGADAVVVTHDYDQWKRAQEERKQKENRGQ